MTLAFHTILTIFFLFQTGQSLSDKVNQTPKDKLVKAQEPVTLTCSHTIPNYYMILWYEQVTGDVALNLIGYVHYKDPATEIPYTNEFNITGDSLLLSSSRIHLGDRLGLLDCNPVP